MSIVNRILSVPLAHTVACLSLLILPLSLNGQSSAADAPTTSTGSAVDDVQPHGHASLKHSQRPVTLNHLYWHFMRYQTFLDETGDRRSNQGKDGTWVHSYLANQLAFDASQEVIIRQVAASLNQACRETDSKAKDAVQRYSALPLKNAQAHESELKLLGELTTAREQAIDDHVRLLNQELGPEAAEHLRTYIVEHFATHVNSAKLHPHDQALRPHQAAAAIPEVRR